MWPSLPDWLPPRYAIPVLVLLGIALVLNPFVPGIHVGDGTVSRYEAARVTYDHQSGLEVTAVGGGEAPVGLDLDDDVVCERGVGLDRVCTFERAVLEGADVPSRSRGFSQADYGYVYLEDTFYEPTVERRDGESYAALEPETDAAPLENIDFEGDLSGPVVAAIDGDTVVVHGDLDRQNQLVRHDGAHYTLYRTGVKRYGGEGSFCASSGAGFCETADAKRWVDSLLTLGSRLLGATLLVWAGSIRATTRS